MYLFFQRSAWGIPCQGTEQFLRHGRFCEQHSTLERYEEIHDDLSKNVRIHVCLLWEICMQLKIKALYVSNWSLIILLFELCAEPSALCNEHFYATKYDRDHLKPLSKKTSHCGSKIDFSEENRVIRSLLTINFVRLFQVWGKLTQFGSSSLGIYSGLYPEYAELR